MKLLVAAAALFAVACVLPRRAHPVGLLALLCLTLTVYPKVLIRHDAERYVGIAPAGLTIYSFTFAVVICVAAAVVVYGLPLLRALRLWLPFIVGAALASLTVWPDGAITHAGEAHFATGIVCFAFAWALLYSGLVEPGEVAAILGVIVGLESVFVLSDVAGHPLYSPTGPQAADLAGRVIGTAQHPDQLAKIMILAVGALLLSEPTSARLRTLHRLVLITAVGISALTEGRAAFVGLVIGVLLFVMLQPDRRVRRLYGALVLFVGGVVAAAASTIIDRFKSDPSGGARAHLTAVARLVIQSHWRNGIGPNHYVDVVGRTDAVTATGAPVHNAFLLAAAELGVPIAALLFLPFAALLISALRRVRASGSPGLSARAFVAITPAIVLVSYTGWGLLETPVFELFCLVAGAMGGVLARSPYPQAVLAVRRTRTSIGALVPREYV